ncbi:MAG: tRNA1(Val) (adenine(37)-N6)-methyltransferase [Deltaproteobacteria bacterium]|nr:tRNA1(Val) (adenine(37)-N6)-methyltransferase [Deltaproteobacteria bacterium]
MRSEETIDEVKGYGLRIIQPRHGYRFSLDPLLLADFVACGDDARIVDLGSGCGVLALLLARRFPGSSVVAVEKQAAMADLARRNAALNALAERVAVLEVDVLDLRSRFAVSGFDAVVSNPPFRVPGTGRVSPREGRDLARHESTAGLADFLLAAKYLVRPAGRIFFIHHPSRLAEFAALARENRLALIRLRLVHGRIGGEAGMFLAELAKGSRGATTVMPPLIVYGEDGGYTPEVRAILGE